MKKPDTLISHEFVEFIPAKRSERTIYVSIEYATAVHSCFCGCGGKVVTPISPTGWKLTFDGDTVALYPSVGNWALPCRSHYWIDRDRAVWAGDMTQEQIDRGRQRDQHARETYFGPSGKRENVMVIQPEAEPELGVLAKFRRWLFRK